jgi:hypothetical protein
LTPLSVEKLTLGTSPGGFTRMTLIMAKDKHLALNIEAPRQGFNTVDIINALVKENRKSIKH